MSLGLIYVNIDVQDGPDIVELTQGTTSSGVIGSKSNLTRRSLAGQQPVVSRDETSYLHYYPVRGIVVDLKRPFFCCVFIIAIINTRVTENVTRKLIKGSS